MALTNRLVEHPGRVLLTPVDGEENTYDLTRAEGEVIEEGSPLDADTLNTEISDQIGAATAGISTDANNNIQFRNLQSGAATLKTKNNAKKTVKKTVTFKTAYTKKPSIVVTPCSTAPGALQVSVSGVTYTGFTIYCYRTSGTTDTVVNWIAFV